MGTEGKLGGQAEVAGVSGTWRDLTDYVNQLASTLTTQLRAIAEVSTAVTRGDLTRSVAVAAQGDLLKTVRTEVDGRPLKGEFLESANIVNTMIKQLSVFTSEVTRVAREVGIEGKLGGQADVKGVAGTWKDLTEN